MVALDPQFAVLAAQCMLSLVALPLPAAAMVVRSPHSNHHTVLGDLHRQRRPIIAPPESKHHSSEDEHSSSPSKKSFERHKERAFLADSRGTVFSTDGSFSGARSFHGVGVDGISAQINDKQARGQEIFQARDSPITSIVDGTLGPVFRTTDGLLKAVLGDDILVFGRHHHDHDYRHHDKVIVYNNGPSHVDIRERHFLEHTRRPSKLDVKMNKRAQEGAPGVIEIRRNGTNFASLLMQQTDGGYVLNASGNNSTTLYLVDLGTTSPAGSEGKMPVQLQLETFNPKNAALEQYCATFDPNPLTPKQMSMESCSSDTTEHKSQLFYYDKASGSLQPTHYAGENNRTLAEMDPSTNTDGSDANEGDLTDDENAQMMTRDVMQSVELVFVPKMPVAINALLPSSETMAQPSATTVTVTETVTPTDSSSVASTAEMSTTSVAETGAPESTSVISATQSSGTGTFDVEVALPSTISSGTPSVTPSDGTVSPSSIRTSSVDPDSVAASIATESTNDTSSGSQTMTASDSSNYATPYSLLVQVTQKASPSTLTGYSA
ncbi:hypothetical protein AX15_000816 [Amanita polypyramis BW_CC]|nr:hypothetical protein AX15_000816 [Amanita polypyramis BW_CC]